ncbi:rhomboid family intramembrane serine protease [Frankia sp. RB7]|nr:rhomboid family intramembrane serine protease [Frankia sp. RB7]
MVIAVASLAAFFQVLGEACTRASNSLVTGRGEGWGYSLFLRSAGKIDTDRQGFPRALPLPFVHLRKAGKGDYLQAVASIAPESETALDSPPQPPSDQPVVVEEAPREPILTLPLPLTAYVVLLAVIHLRVLLPPELENWTIDVFGFIPKRYDSSLVNLQFEGGAGAKVWTFVTYSLLHANLTHLAFNVLWLLPFGSALARRFGTVRFFVFLAVTAAAGALAHLVTHEHAVVPMIGASASVSGAMAAAIRFAFVRGSFLSFSRLDADTAAKVPALPLLQALRDRRIVGFLGVWFALNIIFGVGAIGVESDSAGVAWEAHIGGFVAGLLLFALFDPVPRVRDDDAADASSQDISNGI